MDKHWRKRTDIPDDIRAHLEWVEEAVLGLEYAPPPASATLARHYRYLYVPEPPPPPVFERVDALNVQKGAFRMRCINVYGWNMERWRVFHGDVAIGELDCIGANSSLEKVMDALITTGKFPFEQFGGKVLP